MVHRPAVPRDKRIPWAVLTLAVLSVASVAEALDIEGVHFADTVDVGGQHLVLNGVGVRHATVFNVSVYAAGLYLPERSTDANHILDPQTPKHLIAVFRRGVDHDSARNAFRDAIRNAAGTRASAIQADITRFEAWIPGFEEHQRLIATFTPGSGIDLAATQAHAHFHASVAFGNALFGAWVGPHHVDDGLARGLLGGH